ncbi:putative quinol monooxygenase [Rhodococcus koreensis]
MSNTQLDLVFRFTVKPGKEELYQKAIDHIVPITETEEPYVLAYDIFRSEDGVYAQHESYVDEDAMFRHMERTATGQKDWAEAAEVIEVLVLGTTTERFWNEVANPAASAYPLFRKAAR